MSVEPGRTVGFTLVEVVVAMLLLNVALTGVVALGFVAAGHLTRARMAEWAEATVASVADSLALEAVAGDGERRSAGGRVTWRVGAGPQEEVATVIFEARSPADRLLLRARAILPVRDDDGGGL